MLGRIRAVWGHLPLSAFEDVRMTERILVWRDSLSQTPRAADEAVRALRRLIQFGRDHGFLALDPTVGIKELSPDAGRNAIFWTEEDIAAFVRTADAFGKREVAGVIRLIAATGLGLEDSMALRWEDVAEFTIAKPDRGPRLHERRKLTLPRLHKLTDLLNELASFPRADGVETVLVDERGNNWRRATLAKWIKIIREAAGIEHVDDETGERLPKHLTDLKRTFAIRVMISSDLSDATTGSLMNWSRENIRTLRMLSSPAG